MKPEFKACEWHWDSPKGHYRVSVRRMESAPFVYWQTWTCDFGDAGKATCTDCDSQAAAFSLAEHEALRLAALEAGDVTEDAAQ